MLKLKNVSKFYYSKGIVASGFSKISLDFNLGEFVAITGESGSGKSTLLNVLSGLDSYEEGEMYINNEETSHYTEKDYEIYRKKYISNIFQNFNLVNSYSVYQNIELVLLLNGYKKKDIKEKILQIIKDVDLYKFRNRKVSKLSGGQKQRVAIARALAKDTPIILADEPTGNLDSRSSESVLELLNKISKNKLVIIVTHNYDQIEKYVTRKITMHDGKILEDKRLNGVEQIDIAKEAKFKDITIINKLRLGIRNTFNIIPKFLLVFAVYLFVILAFTSAYSSFSKSNYESTNGGYNTFFSNVSDKRIIITKSDRTAFTNEEYEKISNISGVDKIVKNDLSLDNNISISNNELYLYGNTKSITEYNGKLTYGSMPINDNEVLLIGNKDHYYFQDLEKLVSSKFYLENLSNYTTEQKYEIKITGVELMDNVNNEYNNSEMIMYTSDKIINDLTNRLNLDNSIIKYTFAGVERTSYHSSIIDELIPSNLVPSGKYIIPDSYIYQCKNSKCKNYSLVINIENLFFSDNITLSYLNYYKKSNITKLTGYSYDKYNGAIFINTDDYNNLFNKGYFQSSVFLKDIKDKDATISTLYSMGYKTLYVKDTLINYYEEDIAFINIFKVVVLSLLLFVLFFISYFIIRIILKSRNVYFATLRLLGSSASSVKQLLNIELFTITNLSYLLFIAFIYALKSKIIRITFLSEMYSYLTLKDYVFLYILLFMMSRLITSRYSRELFNTSAMNAYREEVR